MSNKTKAKKQEGSLPEVADQEAPTTQENEQEAPATQEGALATEETEEVETKEDPKEDKELEDFKKNVSSSIFDNEKPGKDVSFEDRGTNIQVGETVEIAAKGFEGIVGEVKSFDEVYGMAIIETEEGKRYAVPPFKLVRPE